MKDIRSSLKNLPSVEKVLEDNMIASRMTLLSRKGITRIVRDRIACCRESLISGELDGSDGKRLEELVKAGVLAELESLSAVRQRRVINATGVVLHTNLGRAVMGEEVRSALEKAASGYVDLEMDLATGARVRRGRRASRLLSLITGAEDAIVLNNNAAAVLLAVSTFAGGGAVAVSRGELVEIGGSFRLPEILTRAAGRVIEIGTTNRTHLRDYKRAVEEGATLLLKVHTSNYRITGYTKDVSLKDLATLGQASGIPVMYDQGSGVLYPLSAEGIEGEDCIGDILDTGVDLVSFSTDKVLGGPQGGVVIGRSAFIEKMRGNHMSRALRVGKLTLAGLERVLLHYWVGEYDRVPALKMITEKVESLRSRSECFAEGLNREAGSGPDVSVREGESSAGGGSYPMNPLRTVLIDIGLPDGVPEKLSASLRGGDPGVLVRVKGRSVLLDLRTVSASEEKVLLHRLGKGIRDILGRG